MQSSPASARAARWKQLWQIARGCRHSVLLALVFTALSAAMAYFTPLVVSFTVDSVLGSQPMQLPAPLLRLVEDAGGRTWLLHNLWICAIAIFLCSVVNGLFTWQRGVFAAKMGEGISRRLRNALYHSLTAAPYAWHKASQTGDLVQRCTSDVETLRRFIQMQLVQIVRTVVMAVTAISIMLPRSALLTGVAVCFLPFLIVFSFFYSRGVQSRFTLADEAEGRLTTALQENLTGMRVVRAFARQKQQLDNYTRLNREYRAIALRLNDLMAVYWGMSDTIGYLQIALVLLVGVLLAAKGTVTLGTVLLFTSYAGMLTFPMRQLGRVLADLVKADVSLGRLCEILNAPAETEPGRALTPPVEGKVEFRHVDFCYDDGRPVLRDISFTVQPGQTVGILGSTGAGKSTLVQLLQRLYLPTSGEILLDGTDIRDIRADHLRRSVGIVLQEPFLFSRTIGENIALARPDAEEEERFSAARTACIHDVICGFEHGYDTVVGERGVTLSGGQKQRVAIARMLVQNTPVCIFDDSLSAVDAETDASIRAALARRNTGTTFLISHRVSTLRAADLILVLEDGRIVQRGTHAQLAAEPGLYRRICAIQNELEEAPV